MTLTQYFCLKPLHIIFGFVFAVSSLAKAEISVVMESEMYKYTTEQMLIDDEVVHKIMFFAIAVQGAANTVRDWHGYIVCGKDSYQFKVRGNQTLRSEGSAGEFIPVKLRNGNEAAIEYLFLTTKDQKGFFFPIHSFMEEKLLTAKHITFKFDIKNGGWTAVRFPLEEIKIAHQQLRSNCTFKGY